MPQNKFEVVIRSVSEFWDTLYALTAARNAPYNGTPEKYRNFVQRYNDANLGLTPEQSYPVLNIAEGLLRNIRHAYKELGDITRAKLIITWNQSTRRGSVRVWQPLPPGALPVDLDQVLRTRPGVKARHSGPGLISELVDGGLRKSLLEEAGLVPDGISIADSTKAKARTAIFNFRSNPPSGKT